MLQRLSSLSAEKSMPDKTKWTFQCTSFGSVSKSTENVPPGGFNKIKLLQDDVRNLKEMISRCLFDYLNGWKMELKFK